MKEVKLPSIDEEGKRNIEEKIKMIENDIGEEVINQNHKEIIETVKDLGDGQEINNIQRRKLWKMLKKKFPKNSSVVPVGKKDKDGKIVTNHSELKHLYLATYTQRLRNRPIKEEFEEIKSMKEDIFKNRLKISLKKKSKAWKMTDLEIVLKALKKDKARTIMEF